MSPQNAAPGPTQETHEYLDGKTRSIQVAIYLQGQYVKCGVIRFNSKLNTGSFTYHDEYAGPSLDPVNLNYRRAARRSFDVDPKSSPDLLHRVFVDYLPGPWGLQVLQAEYPQIKKMKASEKLHWFGTRAVGSLVFYVEHPAGEKPINGAERLEEIRRRSVDFYLKKIPHIGSLESDPKEPTDHWVLQGLSAFGGARPKCIYEDKNAGQWLAKFNIDTDAYNCARVESALSGLAKKCGIDAVESRWVDTGAGNDVLFVRRFDRSESGRSHKVSAFSLMREGMVRSQSDGDYKMLFDLLDRISCDPIKQREEMLRRMLFNIAVNNTDDHLKNFELLLDENRQCYSLSPAYDITVDPYPNPRVTSVFGVHRATLDDEMLDHIAKHVHVESSTIYRIRDQIVDEMRNWPRFMHDHGVSDRDIQKISKAMNHQLEKLDQKRGAHHHARVH